MSVRYLLKILQSFHEYLCTQPKRYRFTDERYDLYKRFLLEAQGRDVSHLLPSNPHLQSQSRSQSPVQSAHVQKDPERKATILPQHEFCLNEDDRLSQKANPETGTPELILLRDFFFIFLFFHLRDWKLYGEISSMHCGILHRGQEQTFAKLSEECYGIIRPEVRWLLKHCKVCSFFFF